MFRSFRAGEKKAKASRTLPYERNVTAQGLSEPVSGVILHNLSGTAGIMLVSKISYLWGGLIFSLRTGGFIMAQITGLTFKIQEMASRIRELREITGFTQEQMAEMTDVSVEEYDSCERGESDLAFAFIYRCSLAFGVDVTDIIQGSSPKLRSYTVTRLGEGQQIEQAHGMVYYNMAASFKNRIATPLYTKAIYDADAERRDIELTTHEGQEFDLVIIPNPLGVLSY